MSDLLDICVVLNWKKQEGWVTQQTTQAFRMWARSREEAIGLAIKNAGEASQDAVMGDPIVLMPLTGGG